MTEKDISCAIVKKILSDQSAMLSNAIRIVNFVFDFSISDLKKQMYTCVSLVLLHKFQEDCITEPKENIFLDKLLLHSMRCFSMNEHSWWKVESHIMVKISHRLDLFIH